MRVARRLAQVLQHRRLANVATSSTKDAESATNFDIRRHRNVGVIAHVDAGKTTLTESLDTSAFHREAVSGNFRLLYLAGASRHLGSVDSGDTTTDHMSIERERGISVQAAAVTFDWRAHRVQLIDTPGHVDFCVEVHRSLRVMDAALLVLDGVAGVEAQTGVVWRAAQRRHLPALIFVSKVDRPNARKPDWIANDVERRLGLKCAPIVVPFRRKSQDLVSLVDLVRKEALDCDGTPNQSKWRALTDEERLECFLPARETLCSRLADVHAQFCDHFLVRALKCDLGCKAEDFRQSWTAMWRKWKAEDLRMVGFQVFSSLSGQLAATIFGSALRWTQCARPVLDGLVDFLSSPEEENKKKREIYGDEPTAFVFKVHHTAKGVRQCYVRCSAGEFRSGKAAFNATTGKAEQGPLKLYAPHSDELRPLDKLRAGEIGVLEGTGETRTGDTLFSNGEAANRLPPEEPIQLVEPVLYCAVEPPNVGQIRTFERALQELAAEDPSIRVRYEEETGETIVEAMGDLHLEILKYYLKERYRLDVHMHQMQIAYREVLVQPMERRFAQQEEVDQKGRTLSCSMELSLLPTDDPTEIFKNLEVAKVDGRPITLRKDWIDAVRDGCVNALRNGPLMGRQIRGARVKLESIETSGAKIPATMGMKDAIFSEILQNISVSACAHRCVANALSSEDSKLAVRLAEPVMRLEMRISADSRTTTAPLLADLAQRRADILNVGSTTDEDGGDSVIEADVPLACTVGLARAMRQLSAGAAQVHLAFEEYRLADEMVLNSARRK